MKKIMAIVGSPRKGGNTEILTDSVVDGCKSKGPVEIDKFFIIDKNIEYCTGCLSCVEPGAQGCVIEDDMQMLLEKMIECDGMIFGTPNHVRSATAPMVNFLSRMLPLLTLKVEQDKTGNVVGGSFDSKLNGKKAAILISQGDPTISSFLVFSLLERNVMDFQMIRVGEVLSLGNVTLGEVKGKKQDLKAAYSLGAILVS